MQVKCLSGGVYFLGRFLFERSNKACALKIGIYLDSVLVFARAHLNPYTSSVTGFRSNKQSHAIASRKFIQTFVHLGFSREHFDYNLAVGGVNSI